MIARQSRAAQVWSLRSSQTKKPPFGGRQSDTVPGQREPRAPIDCAARLDRRHWLRAGHCEAGKNRLPICVAFRQVTRQLRTGALSSKIKRIWNSEGTFHFEAGASVRRLRTTQSITASRPLKTICAPLRTRWRTLFWRSCFGFSIVLRRATRSHHCRRLLWLG
jgi:hypothetical protein